MNVFVVKPRLDATLKISGDHLRRLQIEHATRGKSAHQRVLDRVRIDTGPFGEQHGFSGPELIHDCADLVAGFGDLAGAARADVHDGLCVGGQHRSDAFDRGRRAANHDRQRAGLCSGAATRHWRIEHLDALRRQHVRDPPCPVGCNRAVVHDQGSGAGTADNASFAKHDVFDGLRIGDHRHHDIGLRGDIRRRVAWTRAHLDERCDRLAPSRPDCNRMARVQESSGHRQTHGPQSDESNACGHSRQHNNWRRALTID